MSLLGSHVTISKVSIFFFSWEPNRRQENESSEISLRNAGKASCGGGGGGGGRGRGL